MAPNAVRVAFVGKGGAGKSSIAGTFARVLAASGRSVLALDSDPMPGLAQTVGVPNVDAGIPAEAVQTDDRRQYRLRTGLTAEAMVQQHAVRGPDGVRFLQLGKARGARWDNGPQHAAFQIVLDGLDDGRVGCGWDVVGDLPAGTRQPFQGWGRFATVILVVVEPTAASILSGRRLAGLARMSSAPTVLVVASQVRQPTDAALVAARTGLPLLGSVPFDPRLGASARAGSAPIDHDPTSPGVRAIASLVHIFLSEGGST